MRINETRNQSAGSNRIQVYLIIEKASMFAQVKQAKGKQKKNVQDSIESLIWTCTSEWVIIKNLFEDDKEGIVYDEQIKKG